MNLKSLSDSELISKTETLIAKERALLTEILHHLREIDRRRLFSSLGCKSLFDYATKKLGYSEDQAYRRIQAMKLLKDIPEIEEKINSGALTLSNLSLAQNFFGKEPRFNQKTLHQDDGNRSQKLEFIKKLENRSSKEAQKIVLLYASESNNRFPDRARQVTPELTELRFTIDDSVKLKMEKIKGLYGHTHPQMTMAQLFEMLCDLALERKFSAISKKSRVNKQVWRRDRGECQNCKSQFALEIDHIRPKAWGGGNQLDNLRLLCRNCNQRAAIEKLGLQKMDKFLN